MSAPILSANDPAALNEAVRVLARGGLVAVPTETVYGLAADATNAEAVAGIYRAKGRPSANPLIAHVDGIEMARRYGVFGSASERLAAAFWPGPLTLVVPIARPLTPAVHAGLATVALRHAGGTMETLVQRLGRPLAAPSANRSGRLSPTTAAHVAASLGDRIDLVLDGGACPGGIESTIVAFDPPRILRPGLVASREVEASSGLAFEPGAGNAERLEAPGMMASHYAPRALVRLDARTARADEAHLGFGAVAGDLNLSASGDFAEAARNLYAFLATLDEQHYAIAVAPVPEYGLGRAINDRLRRAAADRLR